ncbi:MAG TPA: PQQ-binding-like beta-propeller repeat protein [Pirellulales bacterium]|nr:PQQ-binding-like beta-propeller repeat protein [Pirellulales bacterium]
MKTVAIFVLVSVPLAVFTPSMGTLAADLPVTTSDWPQWQGPNRDGISSETGLLQQWPEGGPELAWKAAGLGPGFAGVSLQNGRIYTMGQRDNKETVLALDANQRGKPLWCTPIGDTAENGGYGGPRCTPTADGDLVYALGSHGDLDCLNAATGAIVWHKNLPLDFGGRMMSGWGYSESPLIDGDQLICTPGGQDALLVALNKKTGAEIWRCGIPKAAQAEMTKKGNDGAGYSSIVISHAANKKQYVQFVGRGLVGFSPDGKYLWGYNKIANPVANISTPIVHDDNVFASAAYDSGAVQLKLVATPGGGIEAQPVYEIPSRTFQNHHGGMVLVNGYLYAGHGQKMGLPICLDWKTGHVIWGGDQRGPGEGSAAVAYADGRLYFRYEDGTMALIGASPAGYKVYGTFKIPGVEQPSWSHPVIADGKLYLREQDALLCYKLK